MWAKVLGGSSKNCARNKFMSNPEKANHSETSGLLLVLGNRNRREDFAYVRSRARRGKTGKSGRSRERMVAGTFAHQVNGFTRKKQKPLFFMAKTNLLGFTPQGASADAITDK